MPSWLERPSKSDAYGIIMGAIIIFIVSYLLCTKSMIPFLYIGLGFGILIVAAGSTRKSISNLVEN
jgi:hypothetical protein